MVCAAGLLFVAALSGCQTTDRRGLEDRNAHGSEKAVETKEISTVSSDGAVLYGDYHASTLDEDSPLILIFHQGGSNVRGEYGPIIPWLNRNGVRVMAWDLRVGGDLYGFSNRTRVQLADEKIAKSFCDAYPDMEAALHRALKSTDSVMIWGSSYTGALVFRLAQDYPDQISGLIAFSPASGEPMEGCTTDLYIENISTPMAVFSPGSEMHLESAQAQRTHMIENGVEYFIIEEGVHGSSMLVDARTDADMSDARTAVLTWLNKIGS